MIYGTHNGLKPAACSKLVIDVVEVVAECLQADSEFQGDFGRTLALRKKAQYASLLFGEGGNRRPTPSPIFI